jgi:hypothetical protein
MPQTIPWEPLDGDFAYGLIWWCEPGEAPVLHLSIRAPSGERWNFEIVLQGAQWPNAAPQSHLGPTVELQPEAETQ